MGIPTANVKQIAISLAPGESQTITSSVRAIALDTESPFEVTDQGSGIMRITTQSGQRTGRDAGDETTVWSLVRTNTAVKMSVTGGQAPDLSATMIGDRISIEIGFNPLNQGEFIILSKGSDYVEFVNPLAVDESASGTLSIYSSGPVQKGDLLDITSPQFAFPNQGTFAITKVTDKYIEVLNTNVFPQSVGGFSDGFTVYSMSYKWMALVVDRRALVGLNGADANIEVEPPVEGDLVKAPGMFLKRGKVYQVDISNPSQGKLEGFLILAE